jgi:DNA-binding MarR family transcriptional regulator/N-acetylglutamate synthase-like GNAT family acetyltransferase
MVDRVNYFPERAMLREQIEAVRQFNRFYTQKIGVLGEALLGSGYSLTEARVLYELAQRVSNAKALSEDLGIDAGYLSRILKRFESARLISRKRSETDARQSLIELTAKGRKVFAGLDAASNQQVTEMLQPLDPAAREKLRATMSSIGQMLHPERPAAGFVLRPHRAGDMGLIVHRQAILYAEEYGWDGGYEALVCEITAKFLRDFKPGRERCWVAERDGAIAGSVFVVEESKSVARLRMLYVEPSARGHGLGGQLVQECIHFAKETGYRKLTLWTNSVLKSARRIYERAGFVKVHEEPHHAFGHDLVSQTWDLPLR